MIISPYLWNPCSFSHPSSYFRREYLHCTLLDSQCYTPLITLEKNGGYCAWSNVLSGNSNMSFIHLFIHLAVVRLLSTFSVPKNGLEVESTGLKIQTKQNLYSFVIGLQVCMCLMCQISRLEGRGCLPQAAEFTQLRLSSHLLWSCTASP